MTNRPTEQERQRKDEFLRRLKEGDEQYLTMYGKRPFHVSDFIIDEEEQ